jgi:AcrR family transcriptional regulator
MAGPDTFSALPLRARKYAQTKIGLLRAAIAALAERPLDLVPVKDLCAAVSISEASFFNYFPRKSDLLVYFVQLWSVEMAWHARRLAREKGGLAAIEGIFAVTARRIADHPAVMGEIIAHQARMSEAPELGEITLAERLLAYPDLDGIADVPAAGLDAIVPPLLEQAVASGELPRHVDRSAALLAIASIFFGVPIVFRRLDVAAIEPMYREQLRLVWAGLRALPRKGARR